jgi:hypothetical protein
MTTLTDSVRPKLLFIGGYPKGFAEPFSPLTHSGHLLRLIVKRLSDLYDLDVGYYDVWRDAEEEKRGIILPAEREVLRNREEAGYHFIPLGHHLHRAITKAELPANYYPHPARHSNRLYEMLEANIAVWTFEREPTASKAASEQEGATK